MARPGRYAAMSLEALIDLRDRVTQELARRSKQLQAQLEHIGGSSGGVRQPSRNGRRSPMKGAKVAPKYRDPKTGDTWSGRGVVASWLAAKLKDGAKLEDFAVGAAKVAAASKRTATKRFAGRKAQRKAKAK
jgi:DNA-binding protein H-NS